VVLTLESACLAAEVFPQLISLLRQVLTTVPHSPGF
jgi:hypothetical protein